MEDRTEMINDANKEDLFLQIRTAHRLLAAYYQRLLPTIDQITNALDLNFYGWMPTENNTPCRFSSNILDRWQWDLLPANCTRYVFIDAEKKNDITVGKYFIEFHVISDTGILKENRKSLNNQPDALDLTISAEDAKSILRVNLFAPYHDREGYWYDGFFGLCNKPTHTTEPEAQKVEGDIQAFISGFEIPLIELSTENAVEQITERIKTFRDHLLDAAKAENKSQEQ